MMPYTLPLDSPDATITAAGGKGASLSRMARAGFPVPPGFLITTAAYDAFVRANDLGTPIVRLATDQAITVEEASVAIRRLFTQAQVPPDIAAAVRSAYARLMCAGPDAPPVAVRSSATAEDLPGASFAGQQESYLNVRGEQAVLQAVKRCWSSLWTARALEYRARQQIEPAGVSLAVVVQVMVPAEAAGILFTANPLSGARDEMVLDAAWGLGEAIVGGLTTPDHIIADTATRAITHIAIGDKAVMTVPTATGTEERDVDASRRRTQVLNAAQVAELVTVGEAIEARYGQPQDIEWCLADRTFFVVQARPITTLPPAPIRWESPVPGAKWLKDLQAGEWATEPLSPLGATTTFHAMSTARQRRFPLQQQPWHVLMNGWLYIRADYSVPLIPILVAFILRYLRCMHNGHRRVLRVWAGQIAMLDSFEDVDPVTLSDDDLQAHADRLLAVVGWWWWEVSLYAAVALIGEQVIRKLKVPDLAEPAVLFRGNDSLLFESERALRQAATTGEVESYLARFGHFVESADPIHPTLRESPELLKQHLAVARQSTISPDERLVRTRHERREAEQLVRAVHGRRGVLACWMLNAGQSHAAHTDDAVFHFQRVLALVRATFLEVGRRITCMGTLEKAEDVFYVEYGELRTTRSDLAGLVTHRRSLRERQKRLAPPPYIPPLSDPAWERDRSWKLFSASLGETVLKRGAHERNGTTIIVGTPGSPGRARGIARVMTGPDDFSRFQPGDVLVAHTTTPIWTPLFNIASAAVTEVGGPFSHAAIVAREFGIPLVNGAIDATRSIADGAPVVVDGSAGIVEL